MRLVLTLLGVLAATSALAQPRRGAPPQNVNVVNVPDVAVSNDVDVNVANTPDVNVSNSIDVTRMAGFTMYGEPPIVFDKPLLVPGRIHGFTMSLRPLVAPFVGRCTATFSVSVSLSTGGVQSDIAKLELGTNGGEEVMQHDFSSPIEIRFDPANGERSDAYLSVDGTSGACRAQVSVIYETS